MSSRLLIGALALLLAGGASAEPGAAAYQRCAACHLPAGEGIPGAFPPLKGRVATYAASDEGRSYLVAVINAGLMGAITVDGISYMGVMPAQGSSYDAAGISEVLNYAVQVIDKENIVAGWRPFTAEEVAGLLETHGQASGSGNATLRQALLESHPQLQ